ncbi:MAG: L,D-transpeptidase family protein [Bacteroidota bacterium]
MTKRFFVIAGALTLLVIFLKFGRSKYMPLVNKVKEQETLDSRMSQLEKIVRSRLNKELQAIGLEYGFPKKIALLAFKEERKLQVYAQRVEGAQLIKEYPFTGYSGRLGPKLKEGDRQIPEGIYEVEYLNPNSAYYLSIKVSYPNDFDRQRSTLGSLSEMGGDIFIHGKSASIGCIPIGDEAIEELFVLTQNAIDNTVAIIISPRDFRFNPDFPVIDGIEWEKELYQSIETELKKYPN